MALFSHQNHTAIEDASASDFDTKPEVQISLQKLIDLNRQLINRLTNNGIELYPASKDDPVTFSSASTSTTRGMMSLQFMRAKSQALRVERLMGRDETTNNGIESRRHPVIEVRVTPEHLTIELILSPYAWWDQQNLVGKLTIDRHRQYLYSVLKNLDGECKIGYWRGIQLSEMHLKASQLYRQHIMDEWLDTFEPGKDWFRVGMWYEPEAEAISEDNVHNELLRQFKGLYTVYSEILWSSDNNFREFYSASGSHR